MAGETVTIACKLPHGLRLRVFKMVEKPEFAIGGGSRVSMVAEEIPGVGFTVYGNAHPQNAAPRCLIVGDYALTPNCPKDLWDLWLEQNRGSDVVANGLIFAHEKENSARSQAKDGAEIKSGLERLDPNKLPKGVQRAERTTH